MSEHQRRALVRELRDEVTRCADRDQLLVRARQWLYQNKLVIVHERAIRSLIASALNKLEAETGASIAANVDPALLDRWRSTVAELRPRYQRVVANYLRLPGTQAHFVEWAHPLLNSLDNSFQPARQLHHLCGLALHHSSPA